VALLFGVDTVIGEQCLNYLIAHDAYKKILVFVHQKQTIPSPKVEVIVLDFEDLKDGTPEIVGNDLFYCTTSFLQKTTYQFKENTSALKYILPVAKAAAENEVNQFLLLSHNAANTDSILEVHKLRGLVEDQLKSLEFWALHLFKPAFLVDKPSNNWGEGIARWIGKRLDALTGGLVSRYRPIESDVVAKAMIGAAQRFKKGVHEYSIDYLQELAEEYDKYRD